MCFEHHVSRRISTEISCCTNVYAFQRQRVAYQTEMLVAPCELLLEQSTQACLLLLWRGSVASVGMVFGIQSSLDEDRARILLLARSTKILGGVGNTTSGEKENDDNEETLCK